ncbi:MAG: hypothetical protein FD166_3810, partial [Bacteroidetes bacterium]
LAMIVCGSAFAQPVSDRAVVPVAVTLNQVLRLHVTNGGNVEFVFNTIDQYKNGIANSAFYDTDVVIASSTSWDLQFGAEDGTFMGTDDPGNTMPLSNVGFQCDWTGLATCCAAASDVSTVGSPWANATAIGGGVVNGLAVYPAMLMTAGAGLNGGDINDNSFTIHWECGTGQMAGTTTMFGALPAGSLLNQNLAPDRYVTNVLLDIDAI